MLLCLIKKMGKSKWLFLCLILGFIFTTSIVSSIPMYTKSMLTGILQNKIKQFGQENKVDPGILSIIAKCKENEGIGYTDLTGHLSTIESKVKNLGTGYKSKDMILFSNPIFLTSVDDIKVEMISSWDKTYLISPDNLEKNVKIIKGRFAKKLDGSDYYEAIVPEDYYNSQGLKLDSIYQYSGTIKPKEKQLKIKIVGTFEVDDTKNIDAANYVGIVLNKDVFINQLLKNESSNVRIQSAMFSYTLYSNKITPTALTSFEDSYSDMQKTIERWSGFSVYFGAFNAINDYKKTEASFNIIMWMLYMPVLIMLMVYISMVAKLIIENDGDEISVMRSRGASSFYIFKEYIYEIFVVCIIGIILGPLGGKLLCSLLGNVDGFMKFIIGSPIKVTIDRWIFLYVLIVAIVFSAALLIPAALNLKKSIVVKKQQNTARGSKPFYVKYYIDLILLAISAYGIYVYKIKNSSIKLAMDSSYYAVDPLLYIVSTTFFIGLGMLFIRIYPLILKIVFKLTKRFFSNAMYYAILNTERAGEGLSLIMIFIIITASLGIYNIKTANIINGSVENRTRYLNGADITMMAYWKSSEDMVASDAVAGPSKDSESTFANQLEYYEPNYTPFQKVEGIEGATKVLRQNQGSVKFGSHTSTSTYVMGIIPNEFGKIAWFNPDFLSVHWYNYLNALTKEKNAVLISSKLASDFNIKLGDVIYYKWDKTLYLEGKVVGIVNYFPSYNPLGSSNTDTGNKSSYMVVGNLTFMQESMFITPYEVWMKKQPGATNKTIYSSMSNNGLNLQSFSDSGYELRKQKNTPVIKSTNEALTLGFCAAMLVSAMGIIIYSILSLKKRILSFGILRSMGMSAKEVFKMLFYEFILSFGIACAIGVLIGQLTSNIFVPVMSNLWNHGQLVLPNSSLSLTSDYVRLIILTSIIFAVILVDMGMFIKRIKISQAVKLGED